MEKYDIAATMLRHALDTQADIL